jgi:hypothetical protein
MQTKPNTKYFKNVQNEPVRSTSPLPDSISHYVTVDEKIELFVFYSETGIIQ